MSEPTEADRCNCGGMVTFDDFEGVARCQRCGSAESYIPKHRPTRAFCHASSSHSCYEAERGREACAVSECARKESQVPHSPVANPPRCC